MGLSQLSRSASIRQVEATQFTADLLTDAIALVDGSLHLLYGIEAYDSDHDLGLAADQFAVLPRVAPSGLDVIAYSNANGSYLLYLDIDTTKGTETPVVRTMINGPAGALDFESGDLDQDGKLDLVVLNATGTDVYVYYDVSRLTAPVIWQYPGVASELMLVDLDGTGPLELLCIEDDQIKQLSSTGVATSTGDFAGSVTGLTSIPMVGGKSSPIAASYRDAGVDYISTYDAVLGTTSTIDLGDLGVLSLVGSDIDADGLSDLLVLTATTQEILVLINTGLGRSPFLLTPETSSSIPYIPNWTGAPLNPQGHLALSDYDGDGDSDVLFTVDGHRAIELLVNRNTIADDQKPTYTSAAIYAGSGSLDSGGLEQFYEVEFSLPTEFRSNWTHIECFARQRSDTGEKLSFGIYRYSLELLEGDALPNTVQIQFDESFYGTGDIPYYARYVELDGAGTIVDRGPLFNRTFAPNAYYADLNAFQAGLSQSVWVPIYDLDLPVDPNTGGPPNTDYYFSDSREGTGDSPIVPPPPVDDVEGPVPSGIPPEFGN